MMPNFRSCVRQQKSTKKPTEKSSGVKTSEEESKAEAERLMMYKCIISSITESEALYVDCLNTLLQVSLQLLDQQHA